MMPANTIAVLPGNREILRNGDVTFRFRQSSNFYYLTGCNEPNALLILESNGTTHLFNRAQDPVHEQWNGASLGQDGARSILGMDSAYDIQQINYLLPELFASRTAIYYNLGHDTYWDEIILKAYQKLRPKITRGTNPTLEFHDLGAILSEMRLIKSIAEQKCMQHVAKLSVNAHLACLNACSRLTHEYQLEAIFLHNLYMNGCRNVAYDSIVAAGKNACTLHYTANDAALTPNALVLIDAGGEYENYAADITRTYPARGNFSAEQRVIYELVLQAQRQAIAQLKPGVPWSMIQQTITHILTQGLIDLKVLTGTLSDNLERQTYKEFYMHGSGHWLGLDVHDCGTYHIGNQDRLLEPGMTLTVEPGLYFSPCANLDPRWWHIGVRIEDDILITYNGYNNLTIDLPVNIADIESCT